MLNPLILYANKTVVGKQAIFHDKPLDKCFLDRLEQASTIIRASELYDPKLKMYICSNDGSKYPLLIKFILGKDFLSSFYNKIIFTDDTVNYDENYIQLDGHRWNLTQMIAHAEVHCLEFNKYGLLQSNPMGKHPVWKWEGYPEYIARQHSGEKNLWADIGTLLQKEPTNIDGWIRLSDNTETLISFYRYRLFIQFCLEEKKMSFVQLLKDTAQEESVRHQMLTWYWEPHP